MNDLMEGQFIIDKILYPKNRILVNEEFCLFLAKDNKGNLYKFKSNKISLSVKKTYLFNWVEKIDEKYGPTNEVLFFSEDADLDTLLGIQKMLMTITSENIAKNIVDYFKEKTFEILDKEDIKSLTQIYGVGNITALKIIDKYKNIKEQKDCFLKLGKYGFSFEKMKKIIEYYGNIDRAANELDKNIYNIINIEGFSFKSVDKIALLNGYEHNDYRRIVSAVIYCFNMALDIKGWSYMSYKQLIYIFKRLNIPQMTLNHVNQAIDFMLKKNIIIKTGTDEFYSLLKIYNIEKDIKKQLIRISNNKINKINEQIITQRLKQIEAGGVILSYEQKKFICDSVNEPFVCLTGSAGTGKTFTVASLLKVLGVHDKEVYGVALSGRAASNLQDSINVSNCTTIHKLIASKQNNGIEYAEFLKAKIVLLDEATMVSGDLFLSLLKEIDDKKRFVIMGDIKQLPPIGNCQIYHDVLKSKRFNTYTLTKLFRQQGDSQIIPLSKLIADGDDYSAIDLFRGNYADISRYEYNIETMLKGYLKEYEKTQYNLMDIQVCLATNEECYLFNSMIHKALIDMNMVNDKKTIIKKIESSNGQIKSTEFAVGDKVINTSNIYNNLYNTNGEKVTCMNGEIGIIKQVVDDEFLVVEFIQNKAPVNILISYKTLEWGYSCTCHKLQGSGFESVIIGLSNSVYNKLYTREWLYTAVTRAKKIIRIYSSTELLVRTIKQCETNEKQTLLEPMLINDRRII